MSVAGSITKKIVMAFMSVFDIMDFACLQDQVIYVHRQWASLEIISDLDVPSELGSLDTGRLTSQLPQSLHSQFHGREIHSVHFISSGMRSFFDKPDCCSWIATGSEDGAVRITRLVPLLL